ncbi:MAG: hypothetical protein Kow0090_13660 [Myxococcota bacterium]
MDIKELKRGYRNGWILIAAAIGFIFVFFLFTYLVNIPERAERWDMGGKPFVPASSPYANDYHLPANPDYQPAVED